jgi:hypothetical protein
MADRASVVAAARLADDWVEWWLTPPDDRSPPPERHAPGCNVNMGILYALNDIQPETLQRLPRFWDLMDKVLSGTSVSSSPTDEVISIRPVARNPLRALVTVRDCDDMAETEHTEEAHLLEVAAGEFACSLSYMLLEEQRLILETQERDDQRLAVAAGMHSRLGRHSSLRRAYGHELYAPDPLQMVLELSGNKPVSAWRGWDRPNTTSGEDAEASETNAAESGSGFVPHAYEDHKGETVYELRKFENHREVRDDTWPQRQPRAIPDESKLPSQLRELQALARERRKRQGWDGSKRKIQKLAENDGDAALRKRAADQAMRARYAQQQIDLGNLRGESELEEDEEEVLA